MTDLEKQTFEKACVIIEKNKQIAKLEKSLVAITKENDYLKAIKDRDITEEYKIIITGEKRTSVLERFITFREYLLLEGIIDALERAGAPECIKLEHVE